MTSQPTLLQTTRDSVTRLKRAGFWVWIAILSSILICMAIAWLHFRHQAVFDRSVSAIDNIRLTRNHISKSFVALGSTADATEDRRIETSIIIAQLEALDKAVRSKDLTIDALNLDDIALIVSLRANIRRLRDMLANRDRDILLSGAGSVELSRVYFALDNDCNAVDLRTRVMIQALSLRLRSEYKYFIAGAAALLSIICLTVFWVERDRRRAELALQQSEARFRSIMSHMRM